MTFSKNALKFEIVCTGKRVNYFGIPIYVPKGFKWLAMDEDGTIWAYTHKPRILTETFSLPQLAALFGQSSAEIVGYVDHYKGDWRKSLIKVKRLPKVKPCVRT